MKNFITQELVPTEIYELLGEDSLKLMDKKLIETLLFIRKKLDRGITINTKYKGGRYNLRGYRPKNCAIGALYSAHKEGLALDFDVEGMTANDVRSWLKANENLLPHPIRCENGVSWVHIDVRVKVGHKVYFFNP